MYKCSTAVLVPKLPCKEFLWSCTVVLRLIALALTVDSIFNCASNGLTWRSHREHGGTSDFLCVWVRVGYTVRREKGAVCYGMYAPILEGFSPEGLKKGCSSARLSSGSARFVNYAELGGVARTRAFVQLGTLA